MLKYYENATANFSLAQLLASDMQNLDETHIGLFQKCSHLISFHSCKPGEWGWHFNKFKSKLFKMSLRKLVCVLLLVPQNLIQVPWQNDKLGCVMGL